MWNYRMDKSHPNFFKGHKNKSVVSLSKSGVMHMDKLIKAGCDMALL